MQTQLIKTEILKFLMVKPIKLKFFSTFPDDDPLIKKPAQSSLRSFVLYLAPVFLFSKRSAEYIELACTHPRHLYTYAISFSPLVFSSRIQNLSFLFGQQIFDRKAFNKRSKLTFFYLSRLQYSALHTGLSMTVFFALLLSFGPIQTLPQVSSFSLSDRV